MYFVNSIADKSGSFFWGLIIGIAGVLTAFLGPLLGSFSDKKGIRKKTLFYLVFIGFLATSLLWFAKRKIFSIRNSFFIYIYLIDGINFCFL